jgi:hypothetical protein
MGPKDVDLSGIFSTTFFSSGFLKVKRRVTSIMVHSTLRGSRRRKRFTYEWQTLRRLGLATGNIATWYVNEKDPMFWATRRLAKDVNSWYVMGE